MWAIDLTHTSHTRAQTGIQQVCRSVLRALDSTHSYYPIVYDRFAGNWRLPDAGEISCLNNETHDPASQRSSKWTWRQVLKGRLSRVLGRTSCLPESSGIFCPEIIDTFRMKSLFASEWSRNLPKVALFHDAIPVKFPQWCPSKTVAHFPGYLECLSSFDHVICVSRTTQSDLLEYWDSRHLSAPKTSVVSLGIPETRKAINPTEKIEKEKELTILSVGTLEARKNHLNLLKAAEDLWKKDVNFTLKLVGMINKSSGGDAADLIAELQKKGHSLSWTGPVSDDELNQLYAKADIFTYPSLYEGFGIPVLEALQNKIPVLTTEFGALSELVEGGGCITCDGSREGIRDALEDLITDESLRASLAEQAEKRSVRSIGQTAHDIASILQDLDKSRNL